MKRGILNGYYLKRYMASSFGERLSIHAGFRTRLVSEIIARAYCLALIRLARVSETHIPTAPHWHRYRSRPNIVLHTCIISRHACAVSRIALLPLFPCAIAKYDGGDQGTLTSQRPARNGCERGSFISIQVLGTRKPPASYDRLRSPYCRWIITFTIGAQRDRTISIPTRIQKALDFASAPRAATDDNWWHCRGFHWEDNRAQRFQRRRFACEHIGINSIIVTAVVNILCHAYII